MDKEINNNINIMDIRCHYCGHFIGKITIIGGIEIKCRFCKKTFYKKLIPSDPMKAYQELLQYKPKFK